MRLVTFVEGDKAPRPGLVVEQGIVDLGAEGFNDAIEFMGASRKVQAEAAGAVARSRTRIALEEVRLLAPVPNPPRVFGIGVNYADHAAESGTKMRDVPTVFIVLSSAVVGPGAEVVLPANSSMVDYEAELAMGIGKAGHRIAASDWEEHVFGYTMMNDVSARDVQRATRNGRWARAFRRLRRWGRGSSAKTRSPTRIGLGISMTIGGERLQDANTSQMIYKIPALIEYFPALCRYRLAM